jgi:hypothetical protein
MKLPRWIWRLNTVGTIAVANLACFGFLGLLLPQKHPGGVLYFDREPGWRRALEEMLLYGMLFLAFPVGWLSGLYPPIGPPWAAVVFVPVNAYVWGKYGAFLWDCHKKDPRWIFKWFGLLFLVLAAVLVIVGPFWLLRVLRDPGKWDISILCLGTALLASLLFGARWSLTRVQRLTMHARNRDAP